jgi:REP element-mobilizing transposase RayT
MNNHIHVIWHLHHPHKRDEVQRDMLKFTAQTIIRELRNEPEVLQQYYVGARDRKHQVWERNPLTVPLWTEDVVKQKVAYLHNNPVRAGLCAYAEDYKYSTASLYSSGEDRFGFIEPFYF